MKLMESPVLPTEAIGFDGREFLNQVVAFEKEIEPLALLETCQQIERELGRKAHKTRFDASGTRIYSDRTIDIDILTMGAVKMATERLTLPHPQCRERPYVAELVGLMPEDIKRQYTVLQ